MLPLPYLLLAAAVACALSFGTGWHYGGKVVKADWANAQIDAAAAKADADQRVFNADKKSDALQAELRRVRAQKQRVVIQEVLVDAAIPDPAECHLDDRRVSTINRAIRAAATDPGGKAATVQPTGGTDQREPQRSRTVGGADSGGVPRVQ